MLHTFHSNSTEALRALLVHQLAADRRLASGPDRLFVSQRVIVPSLAVQKDLEHAVARSCGVCAGIDFLRLSSFLQQAAGTALGEDAGSSRLLWAVWKTLQNEEFVSRHPRLSSWLEGKTPEEVFGLARRVTAVFSRYAGWRPDWLLHWLGITPGTGEAARRSAERLARETARLESHPDFLWQKEMFLAVAGGDAPLWPDALGLRSLPEVFERLLAEGLPGTVRGDALHVYLPTSLAPLALPFLKLAAEGDRAQEVFLYLRNPSRVYWFESLPPTLSQWPDIQSEEDGADRRVLDWLRRNAAAPRALLERVWRFSAAGENVLCEADGETPPAPRPVRQMALERLQDLRLDAPGQTEFVFLRPQGTGLLAQLQRAVLEPGEEGPKLRGLPEEGDDSLLFVRSPSFERELESCADQIQGLLRRHPDWTPADILVAVPSMETAAPAIESVFAALPPARRIAWQMVGRSQLQASGAAQTVLALGTLAASRIRSAELLAWLSMPAAARAWGLDLDDLDAARMWLSAAGFRWGLTPLHVADACADGLTLQDAKSAEDGCLERALERLCLGCASAPGVRTPVGDVIPASGTEDGGFQGASDRPATMRSLLRFSELLEEARRSLRTARRGSDWGEWTRGLTQRLLGNALDESESHRFFEALSSVCDGLERVLGEETVEFSVFWKALSEALSAQPSHVPSQGAVTFASIENARGLAFRAVFVLGLNADSGFPAAPSPEEFDLTASLPRSGDRDARLDQRAAFLELVIGARDALVLSWSEGTDPASPVPPSPVLWDLQSLLESLGADLKACSVSLPLSPWSAASFQAKGDAGRRSDDARWWRSTDAALLPALRAARESGHVAPPPLWAAGAGGAPWPDPEEELEKAGLLDWSEVVDFAKYPDRWRLARAQVRAAGSEIREADPEADPLESALFSSRETALLYSRLEEGWSAEDLAQERLLDPRWGFPGLRQVAVGEALTTVTELHRLMQEFRSSHGPERMQSLRVRMSDEFGVTLQASGRLTQEPPVFVQECMRESRILDAWLAALPFAAVRNVRGLFAPCPGKKCGILPLPRPENAAELIEELVRCRQAKMRRPRVCAGPLLRGAGGVSLMPESRVLLRGDPEVFRRLALHRAWRGALEKSLSGFGGPDEDALVRGVLEGLRRWRGEDEHSGGEEQP